MAQVRAGRGGDFGGFFVGLVKNSSVVRAARHRHGVEKKGETAACFVENPLYLLIKFRALSDELRTSRPDRGGLQVHAPGKPQDLSLAVPVGWPACAA